MTSFQRKPSNLRGTAKVRRTIKKGGVVAHGMVAHSAGTGAAISLGVVLTIIFSVTLGPLVLFLLIVYLGLHINDIDDYVEGKLPRSVFLKLAKQKKNQDISKNLEKFNNLFQTKITETEMHEFANSHKNEKYEKYVESSIKFLYSKMRPDVNRVFLFLFNDENIAVKFFKEIIESKGFSITNNTFAISSTMVLSQFWRKHKEFFGHLFNVLTLKEKGFGEGGVFTNFYENIVTTHKYNVSGVKRFMDKFKNKFSKMNPFAKKSLDNATSDAILKEVKELQSKPTELKDTEKVFKESIIEGSASHASHASHASASHASHASASHASHASRASTSHSITSKSYRSLTNAPHIKRADVNVLSQIKEEVSSASGNRV